MATSLERLIREKLEEEYVAGEKPVVDTFDRTVASGWGESDSGHTWAADGGTAGSFTTSVGGGIATFTKTANSNQRDWFVPYGEVDYDVTFRFRWSKTPTSSGYSLRIPFRWQSANEFYFYTLTLTTGAAVQASINRWVNPTNTTLVSAVTAVSDYTPGDWLHFRGRVLGDFVGLKLWEDGDPEPEEWTRSATDASPIEEATLRVGVSEIGNIGNYPISVNIDDFTASTGKLWRPTPFSLAKLIRLWKADNPDEWPRSLWDRDYWTDL